MGDKDKKPQHYRPFKLCSTIPGSLFSSICANVVELNQFPRSLTVCVRHEIYSKSHQWQINYTCVSISTELPSMDMGNTATTNRAANSMMMPMMSQTPMSMMSQASMSMMSQTPMSMMSQAPMSMMSQAPMSMMSQAPMSMMSQTPMSMMPSTPMSMMPSPSMSMMPSTPMPMMPSPSMPMMPSPSMPMMPSPPMSMPLKTNKTPSEESMSTMPARSSPKEQLSLFEPLSSDNDKLSLGNDKEPLVYLQRRENSSSLKIDAYNITKNNSAFRTEIDHDGLAVPNSHQGTLLAVGIVRQPTKPLLGVTRESMTPDSLQRNHNATVKGRISMMSDKSNGNRETTLSRNAINAIRIVLPSRDNKRLMRSERYRVNQNVSTKDIITMMSREKYDNRKATPSGYPILTALIKPPCRAERVVQSELSLDGDKKSLSYNEKEPVTTNCNVGSFADEKRSPTNIDILMVSQKRRNPGLKYDKFIVSKNNKHRKTKINHDKQGDSLAIGIDGLLIQSLPRNLRSMSSALPLARQDLTPKTNGSERAISFGDLIVRTPTTPLLGINKKLIQFELPPVHGETPPPSDNKEPVTFGNNVDIPSDGEVQSFLNDEKNQPPNDVEKTSVVSRRRRHTSGLKYSKLHTMKNYNRHRAKIVNDKINVPLAVSIKVPLLVHSNIPSKNISIAEASKTANEHTLPIGVSLKINDELLTTDAGIPINSVDYFPSRIPPAIAKILNEDKNSFYRERSDVAAEHSSNPSFNYGPSRIIFPN